jgi:hypothetical protein
MGVELLIDQLGIKHPSTMMQGARKSAASSSPAQVDRKGSTLGDLMRQPDVPTQPLRPLDWSHLTTASSSAAKRSRIQ